LFNYCTDVLHLSEPVAQLRITASRRYPVILTMLEDGRIHLSAIGLLAKHLTDANYEEVLTRATHKSKRQVKELVAELAPKPDAPPSIRKVPERSKNERQAPAGPTNTAHTEATSSGQSKPEPPTESAPKQRDPRAKVEPLSPARYIVRFTASAELRDKLDRLKGFMPGTDLASMIEAAVTEKLDRIEARRYGKTKNPRKSLEDAATSPGVRGVSAPVARFVWARDGGRCTFVGRNGRRCPEHHGLELHHDDPFGLGGDRSADNLRLMCTAHNLYLAEQDYGKEWMDQFRRSDDCAREPDPSFESVVSVKSPRATRTIGGAILRS